MKKVNRCRPLLWSLSAALGLLALGVVPACSSDNSSSGPATPTALRVQLAESLGSYTAIAAWPSGQVLTVSCPGTDQGPARCVPKGLLFDPIPQPFELTVKVPGYHFFTQPITPDSLPIAGSERLASLPLTALEPAQHTDDYDTGFSQADGLSALSAIAYPADTELGPSQVIKFYIRHLSTKPEVYFQNTRKHQLHYEFAHIVLGEPESVEQFEQNTYHGANRDAMAGTLVFYPSVQAQCAALGAELSAPIALTFFPSDDLSPEQAQTAYQLIEERLGFLSLSAGEHRLVYLPAGETQENQLAPQTQLFSKKGDLWSSLSELYGNTTLQILNPGLAFGTLRLLSPEQLATTVVSYRDVLVLTRLPNTLPIVGGTITEELQTPLAHVNLAARSRGTPNVALIHASQDSRVAGLLNKLVRFEVKDGAFTLREATLQEAQEFWDSHSHAPFSPAYDDSVAELVKYDDLHFADSNKVGVKAANLAELYRVLRDKAPYGFAVPFHFYNQYMSTQTVASSDCEQARIDCTQDSRPEALCAQVKDVCTAADGVTLWTYMDQLLASTQFQSDTNFREACLDGFQYLIRHGHLDATVAQQLDSLVRQLFGSAKVRIRSSTNAEDLTEFSGAGLYDSVSAYAEGDDRASKEIRKVWASVWNWRAFEERAFWNVDHHAVRMGCAVEPAYPDEAANGVLVTQNVSDPTVAGMYVNVQLGETSVTNPEDGSLPEVFSIVPAPSGLQVIRQRYSSLSPGTPILSDSEVATLFAASYLVQNHFAPLYQQDPNVLALDLEFKFNGPNRDLIIKQARPYTQASMRP